MDQQAWDGQPEKMEMVLGVGGKKTWIGRFIFIALLRVSWENIIRSLFDASCLAATSSPLSLFPLTDKSYKCNMIERFVFFLFQNDMLDNSPSTAGYLLQKQPWSEQPPHRSRVQVQSVSR